MRKTSILVVLVVLLMFLVQSTLVVAEEPINVFINGEQILFSIQPTIEDGTTLVEFRPIFEKLGLQVGWEQATETVTGSRDGLIIKLQIGSKTAAVNGQAKELLLAPKVVDGHTLVPIRFVGEASGKNVKWNSLTNTINITTEIDNSLPSAQSAQMSKVLDIKTIQLGTDDFNFAFFEDGLAVGVSQEADNDGIFKGYVVGIKNMYTSPINLSEVSLKGINKETYSTIEPTNALYSGKLGTFKLQSTYSINPNNSIVVPIVFMSKDNVHAIKYSDSAHTITLDIPHISISTRNDQALIDTDPQKSPETVKVLTTTSELKEFLENNFSDLNTSLGFTSFTFNIYENKSITSAYDYWIQVRYNSEFFYNVKYSNKLSSAQRSQVKKELKEFQEKLAKAVIKAMPDKKIYGGYYDSWYRYPNLRVDLITRRYYSWVNFNGGLTSSYEDTEPSEFRWYDFIDDDF